MELSIEVCTNSKCYVTVEDTTEIDDTGYLSESSTSIVKYRYKYSETVSIDVLRLNKSDSQEIQDPVFTIHEDEDDREVVTLKVAFDGWFDVFHIVIPSEDWFNNATEAELALYSTVYYTDGEIIYKYIDGETETVTVDELIDRNSDDTTISIVSKTYVSICFLKQCYLALCLKIFNSRGFSSCFNKNSIDDDLIFRRDIVWMAINVIKYLVEFSLLAEALRIIEQISGCNAICSNTSSSNKSTSGGCGCSK